MAEDKKAKGPKDVIYILVPQPSKVVHKGSILVSQDHAEIVNGQMVAQERSDQVDPDTFGCYAWKDNHWNNDRRVFAVEQFQAKKNTGEYPFLIGPFDSRKEAYAAMHTVRPKDAKEENAILKAQNAEQDKQLAELREKLAKAQKPAKSSQKENNQK